MRARRSSSSSRLCSLVFLSAFGACSAPNSAGTYDRDLLNALAASLPPEGAPTASVPAPRPPPSTPTQTPRPDHEPLLVHRDLPAQVIAGREVFFGLDVFDDDHDDLRVELTGAPEGAELDARTLTVRWRVPRAMRGAQRFTARITQERANEPAQVFERPFEIEVVARGPVSGAPAAIDPTVAAMVTITAEDFLAQAAREFPLDRVLEIAQSNAIDALPEERRRVTASAPGRELFAQLMSSMATLHHNPSLDVARVGHDPRAELSHWRLVAVRPRVNKAIEELRLAYRAVDLPYPAWVMLRVRLFRGANPPNADVVRANNEAFTRLVHQAFYAGPTAQRPRPGMLEGRASVVAPAVASLVRAVLNFRDPSNPLLRTGLAAIPQEARAGGGSAFAPDGTYLRGNAWAFTVANLKVEPIAAMPPGLAADPAFAPAHPPMFTHQVRVVNVPVSSFTFDIGPTSGGDAITSVCPPAYRDGGAGNEPGMSALCEADGTVRIRERNAEGRWVATRRDSMTEHRAVVFDELLGRVSLRDPRRRVFEESGMTCVQCHTRTFDDGVLSEAQVSDPRVHEAITPAREVARVALQILPVAGVARSPWLAQQETFQVCDLGRHFRAAGFAAELPCPEGY